MKGKAAAIVQDTESYQRLLDIAAKADVSDALRQAYDDMANGSAMPATEAFDVVRKRYGIKR